MLERCLLALQRGDLLVQRGDQRAGGGEILDLWYRRLSHPRTLHEIDRPYNGL
jgi:hypothetical protein